MKNEKLLKVYCGDFLQNKEYLEILNPNFGFKKRKNIFKDGDIFDNFIEPIVEVVLDPKQADVILIPHNYFSIKFETEYINSFVAVSEKYSIKIVIFAIGDSTEDIDIKNSTIIRMSKFKSTKRVNEVIIPAYAADLSYGKEVVYRKKRLLPSIGFCGWANIVGLVPNLLFLFKNTFLLKGFKKQGLYFRIKSLNYLSRSKKISTNFIIRSSYSASEKTIELDAQMARREYRENMINSDFVLAPKGDGNYSVRFYEALSLGRVPILIDTDCPLPLENALDYSKFILRVDYRDIKNLDKIVADFYSKISEDEWTLMQKNARAAFDQCLRIDVFFQYLFKYENHLLS